MKLDLKEVYESYIIESVHEFTDSVDFNPFNAIRALQEIRTAWPVTDENKDRREPVLKNINAIETLLLDIAEGQANYNQALLNNYEHNPPSIENCQQGEN